MKSALKRSEGPLGPGERCFASLSMTALATFLARLLVVEKAFDGAHEEADAERDGHVVEVVARVVQADRVGTAAIAHPRHGTRHALQHVGEVLRAHAGPRVVGPRMFAADAGGDVDGKARALDISHRRR